jgi:flavin reductase (DIM6/NTAB) family NADH-FMN oxidoreductase RutF
MHHVSSPSILYFGTPVVVISTLNEDGTSNLAPISSVFWLGYRCMIGLSAQSKTTENLLRTRECVLNLPSVDQAAGVDRLALTTGSDPVPPGKASRGYQHESDKWRRSGFTPLPSNIVDTPRIYECPVQLEASLAAIHPIGADAGAANIRILSFELKILRVHLHESILADGRPNHVDPDKWRPLIMSFQQFYGLGERVHSSTLAQVPEHLYRTADTASAAVGT